MATISSLSSSTSKSSTSVFGSTSKGIGGLVSGLDTDTIIDGMTIGTRTKIAKQKQSKQKLQWKMDAYQTTSTSLINFSNKYSSYASTTNLYSASFFARNVIKASGDNSKYVTVSGTAASSTNITLSGVKQLAKNASFTTTDALSNNYIKTGTISYGIEDVSTITDKRINIKHGNETYYVTLPDKEDGSVYTSASEIADALNSAFSKVDLTGGMTGKLSDVIHVGVTGDTLQFTNNDNSGNSLSISGGDSDLIQKLGLSNNTGTIIGESITGTLDAKAGINASDLKTSTTFLQRVSGKSVTFTYNGTAKTIKLDDETKLNSTDFKGYLQDKLNSAFGNGRINVTESDGALKFETTTPDGNTDTTSVLKMSSSDAGLFGSKSVFGVAQGTSNKLNLGADLKSSGMKGAGNLSLTEGENIIRINGKEVKFTYTEGTTSLADVMAAINNSDAGVKVSYMENSDKLVVNSTQNGASGDVKFGDSSTGDLNNIEKFLFGKRDSNGDVLATNEINGNKVDGQDAKIMVDFDGEGGADPIEVVRDTNNFNLDGLNIGVSGCFGYDSDGNKIAGTDVTFDASANVDSIVDAVKSMISDYNAIVKATNTTVTEKKNLDYAPLTDEQKKDMSESQIKAWEDKAKAGVLFGDTNLISLTNDLRFAFFDTGRGVSFSDMGITVSSSYSDNGAVSLDESKLRSMLKSNLDGVKKAFTDPLDTTSVSGGTSSNIATGGIMSRMKSITDKYAKTSGAVKGILVETAGNPASPLSMLTNTIQKQMDSIDDVVTNLQTQLKSEQTRYQAKFTQLEQLVQKMNSQSSWLSGMGGNS